MDKQGYIMVMECGHSQVWGEDVKEKPVVGELAWCVWCQKMERIIKVV